MKFWHSTTHGSEAVTHTGGRRGITAGMEDVEPDGGGECGKVFSGSHTDRNFIPSALTNHEIAFARYLFRLKNT